jgi:hypothetical protein
MQFIVVGANKNTGATVNLTIEARDFRDAEEQANDMGVLVTNVRAVEDQKQLSASPQVVTVQRTAGCAACGSGPLVRDRVYRLSGPAVAIGYILLIPSIIGIVGCGILLVLSALGMTIDMDDAMVDTYKKMMRDAGITEPIINKVINNEPLTPDDLSTLDFNQVSTIQQVQETKNSAPALACCGLGIFGFGAIGGMILSFVSGLLGWLLVMKKNILQCRRCGASVPVG